MVLVNIICTQILPAISAAGLFSVMLILVLVLKDALRTIFEVLVLVLESQVLVLILVLVV